jgi:transcription elongation factor GreA
MRIEGKIYLTKAGVAHFTDELVELKRLRMECVKADESHEDLVIIDKKLDDVAAVLQSYELISLPPKHKRDVIDLGATVTVRSSDGHMNELTIVGTLEANPPLGLISNESPVGRALLGARVGDSVLVHANSRASYTVKHIAYGKLGKIRRA